MGNYKFDVNREDLYEYQKPKDRTRKRLIQLAELGLEEVGLAEFGILGKCSGLYIERVWHDSDGNWLGELEWIKSIINKHN